MGEVTLGLVQIKSQKGAIGYNIISMYKYLEECRKEGVEIVCFPEMNITGYIDPNVYPDAVLSRYHTSIQRVADMSFIYQTVIIAGFAEKNHQGKPYIAQLVAKDGRIAGCYRKRTLSSEEAKWYSPGTETPIFMYLDKNFGLAACSDTNNERIFKEYAERGACLVFGSAAPGIYAEEGNGERKTDFELSISECKSKFGQYASENEIYIAATAQTGYNCGEDCSGGGYVFTPKGDCIYETENCQEGMLVAKILI